MTEVFSTGATREWAVLYYLSTSDDTECGSTLQAFADVRSAAAVAAFTDGATDAARVVVRPGAPAQLEHLGATNAGDPATFEQFLSWALDECRAERYVLVLGGLAPRAAALALDRLTELPDFIVALDVASNDALEVAELADVLRRMFPKDSGRRLIMIGCDTFQVQFLEAAHELRDCTDLLVGIQPDDRSSVSAPWPYASLLERWQTVFERAATSDQQLERGGIESDARALMEETFSAVGTGDAASDSSMRLGLSAINMTRLPLLTEAVDAFTATYVQWLSNQVIWRVRDQVVRKLQGGLQRSWSYDVGAFAAATNEALEECDREAIALWAAEAIPRLPFGRLSRMLRLFGAAARELAGKEPEPYRPLSDEIARCRSRLERAISVGGDRIESSNILKDVRGLFVDGNALRHPAAWRAIITASQDRFSGVVAMELAEILDGITTAGILRRSVGRISNLVRSRDAGDEIAKTQRQDSRCGLALYRPPDLEQMADSAYVRLRFSRECRWSALLTAVNLIEHHSLALWRVVSGQLAGGSAAARRQIISKLTGDRALTGRHAAGFRALSGPDVLLLSIDRVFETSADLASDIDTYRVTLSSTQGLVVERRNQSTTGRLKRVLEEVEAIRRNEQFGSKRTFEQLTRCGSLLGDDLLYGISERLGDIEPDRDGVHLIVETLPEMSHYPWELLRDRNGFLVERFAIARRLSGESSVAISTRHYSPLRILLLAPRDERSNSNVMGGVARHIAATLTELQAAWPGLIAPSNFAKYIDVAMSAEQARRMLVTRPYDVVHFAGRVDHVRETDSGGWLFSDGSLDPSTLEALLAQANAVPMLVCESWTAAATAPDKGIALSKFEMATAGLRAGVAAWVGASHAVREDDARVLFSAFYKTLLARHSTVGEALGVGRALLMGPPGNRIDLAPPEGGTHVPRPFARWIDALDRPESRREATTAWVDIVLFGDPTVSLVRRFRPSD